MKERPIQFNAAMACATLEDRKTQTRRVVRGTALEWLNNANFTPEYVALPENGFSPYGYAGDRLWGREAWRTTGDDGRADNMPPRDLQPHQVWYEADGAAPADECVGKYRPSMFMPRWASRITLEITSVRVERLQDISEEDSLAEGIKEVRAWARAGGSAVYAHAEGDDVEDYSDPRDAYRVLWDSLNAERGFAWAANPWVWVVEFRRIEA